MPFSGPSEDLCRSERTSEAIQQAEQRLVQERASKRGHSAGRAKICMCKGASRWAERSLVQGLKMFGVN